jgi:Skp family chaperone for outer membrane proteins
VTGRLVETQLRIAFPALVFVLSNALSIQAQTTGPNMIAVVNIQHVIEGTVEFQRAAEKWTVAMTVETAGLSAKQEELRQAESKLAAEQQGLTEPALTRLVRTVSELQREFDRMNADVQTELNGLRERLILPITATVDRAIQKFAEENDLALILDISNPEVGIALTNDTIDITATIVDYIEHPTTSGNNP